MKGEIEMSLKEASLLKPYKVTCKMVIYRKTRKEAFDAMQKLHEVGTGQW